MLAENVRRKGDDALVLALARGQTYRDAATEAGLSEKTAQRRVQEPAFRQAVANARTLLFAQAVGQLADAAVEAVVTLRTLLAAQSESVQLGAARAILEAGPRLRESEELAARISALEAALARDDTRGGNQWRA